MRILIAAASFATNISGVQRHAFNVVRCLLPQSEVSQIHISIAPWQQNLLASAELPRSIKLTPHAARMEQTSWSRNLWYYRDLPKLAADLNVDIVHLTHPMPLHAGAFRCPTVVSLHDLYPYEIPNNFGFPKFIFNRFVLQQCLRGADAIACVSEATSARLRQFTPPLVWRKSVRIFNCVEPGQRSTATSPIPNWRGQTFLLCVAQHRRNKNLLLLIRSFARMRCAGEIDRSAQLVVLGIQGPESGRIHALIKTSELAGSVHLLEGISEQELQWCYQNCAVLVAPSVTEGFGLPVAEGLLAGCRIVCSDIPAHREVAEGSCRFVSLQGDVELNLCTAIKGALNDAKPSPKPLPQLSGPILAKQYIALYRRVIASSAQSMNEVSPYAAEGDMVSVPNQNLALHLSGNEHSANLGGRTSTIRPN